jgi:pilus assembly protein CpaB
MRRSLIIMLAVAAASGTLALLEFARPAPQTETSGPAQSETVRVLVFQRNLARGTVMDDTSIGWQDQLRGAVPPDAIVAPDETAPVPEDVIDKVLRGDVLAGELVRVSNFVDAAAGFMALALSPGMRAVGISVTPQKLAGGFILPDDRIDLIHTAAGDFNRDGVQGSFSQTILENIRVLAVGDLPTGRITFKTADQQEDAGTRKSDVNIVGETITLEMTDAEAEVLFSALASGQVSLALRALDDHGASRIVSTVGFETPEPPEAEAPEPAPTTAPAPVAAAPTPPPAAPPAPTQTTAKKSPPPNVSVRIIQGGSASFVDVPAAKSADAP